MKCLLFVIDKFESNVRLTCKIANKATGVQGTIDYAIEQESRKENMWVLNNEFVFI